MTPKVRWTCPVTWRDPEAGEMRFHAIMNDANEPAGMAFMDWFPLDAATWPALHLQQPRGMADVDARVSPTAEKAE